jgi:predicted ATPase/DNA-binding winged helix-turn-helix (wHTH) protein
MSVAGESENLRFDRFELLLARRELRVDGVPVTLGGRAFDILALLVKARGALVTKDQIISAIWPDLVVEESNIQVQISALRKALGSSRNLVQTVSGRGYRFVAALPDAAPARDPSQPATNLPAATAALIGRDAEVLEITRTLAAHRLVTLTGPGGIGKTRLGFEVARAAHARFADGVWVADFATLSDPKQVPGAVASALGLEFAAGAVLPERLARELARRQIMLVLDNCEHVIEAVARTTDAVLRASRSACLLVTSREPLNVEGEWICRVSGLTLPADEVDDPAAILRCGAVQLFLARARAVQPQLADDARIAATAAAICRRLDGIPLAIELAAARVAALGVDGLAARLDDQFKLLTGGWRTALPRHQTLRATLDWSYDALPEAERAVLRCLAVFAGPFTLEAAACVAADDLAAAAAVGDCVESLVTKSLVVADVGSGVARYQLLMTTRAYALDKLAESGAQAQVARRHATYFRDLLAAAQGAWETLPATEWLPAYRGQIGNLRAALDWTFAPGGDIAIGVDLLVASVPLWTQLSLMEECRERVERALALLGPEASRPTRRNMQLYAALGNSLMPDTAALQTALALAEELGDNTYRLRALWGLWTNRLANVALDEALALAERFAANARHQSDRAIGDRMMGFSLHFLGQHEPAREHIARMLDERAPDAHGSRSVRFQFDPWVTARATLGEILWVRGFPEQAMRAVEIAVADARAIDHAHSLCNTLRKACPVAAFCGDLAALERFTTMLFAHAARHGFASWHAQARCYDGLLRIARGDVAGGLQVLRDTLDGTLENNSAMRSTFLRGALADALGRSGAIAQAQAEIDPALARAEANREGWCVPELLRIKGELCLLAGAAAAAEESFLRALDLARRNKALSWELRSATSLARVRLAQDRRAEARDLLGAVLGRFSEGFATADLVAAKRLLSDAA